MNHFIVLTHKLSNQSLTHKRSDEDKEIVKPQDAKLFKLNVLETRQCSNKKRRISSRISFSTLEYYYFPRFLNSFSFSMSSKMLTTVAGTVSIKASQLTHSIVSAPLLFIPELSFPKPALAGSFNRAHKVESDEVHSCYVLPPL
jgi:hypothetical protein